MKFEHQVMSLGEATPDAYLLAQLRKFENDGYELVAVAPGFGSNTRYFFKRQVDLHIDGGTFDALAPTGRHIDGGTF
jgi:hypothetical protein